jgi:phosphoribosylanthranilate isomerase
MARTRVKICGITRPEDAALAAELGADAIGLNFVGGPRRINIEQAQVICWANRDRTEVDNDGRPIGGLEFIALCGVDRAQCPDVLAWYELARQTWPRAYQLYGQPREPLLTSVPYWLVMHIADRNSIVEAAVAVGMMKTLPAALVFDTAAGGKQGGTGKSFDWQWIAEARAAGELEGLPPIILAGGLTPGNVAEAIRIARPYAVDVSSGVEVAGKPGVKDPVKMRDFIQAVQGV